MMPAYIMLACVCVFINLFNLFDANCLDEYQVLSAFEERGCLALSTPIEDGFTFE